MHRDFADLGLNLTDPQLLSIILPVSLSPRPVPNFFFFFALTVRSLSLLLFYFRRYSYMPGPSRSRMSKQVDKIICYVFYARSTYHERIMESFCPSHLQLIPMGVVNQNLWGEFNFVFCRFNISVIFYEGKAARL